MRVRVGQRAQRLADDGERGEVLLVPLYYHYH